jgi:hypothetical protein
VPTHADGGHEPGVLKPNAKQAADGAVAMAEYLNTQLAVREKRSASGRNAWPEKRTGRRWFGSCEGKTVAGERDTLQLPLEFSGDEKLEAAN